jgi:uncharacterized protein YoxC
MPSSPDAQPAHAAPAPRTRASSQQTGNKSRPDLLADPHASVRTKEQARTFLDKHGFLAKDSPAKTDQLSYVLLSLAHSSSGKTLEEGVRAVAILLTDEAAKDTSAAVLQYVEKSLGPVFTKVDEVIDAVRDIADTTRSAADEASMAVDEICSVQRIRGELREEAREEAATGATYAAALKGNVPLSHPSNLARARARERQILIDRDPRADHNTLGGLSERELVAKANEALTQLGEPNPLEEVSFVGAKILTNGGVVYELNKPTAAEWVQANKAQFVEKLGGASVVKERAVSVLVEYVPLTHAPEALGELRKIERDSRLPTDALLSTRWIKPAGRRTQGQRSAHLIAKFSNIESANQSIRDGLIIAGKRTWARRMKREPRRCLKCQKQNARHMAADCSGVDVCGTCGKGHRTAECEETDPAHYRCVNCDKSGHASWDRTCPIFISTCQAIERADPEGTYKYFPNDKPWTWEQRGQRETTADAAELLKRVIERDTIPNEAEQPQHPRTRGDRRDQGGSGQVEAGRGKHNTNPEMGHRDTGWQGRDRRQRTLDEYGRGGEQQTVENGNNAHQG